MDRPGRHRATFLASRLLFVEAALMVLCTVVGVQLAGALADFNFCMSDCGPTPPSTRVSTMVLAGAVGGFLVALHVVAGIGVRRGWRRGRWLGMVAGLVWLGIGVLSGPLAVAFFALGLVTILACTYVPDPA